MADKSKIIRAIFPNAGVEAWYRQRLQGLVRDMSNSVLEHVRAAWNAADPDIGFAHDGKSVLAAGVMFRNPDGRILLLRRTDGEGWAFPAGGVEAGETPEMAARREAGEETGWAMGDPLVPLDVREARGVRFSTFRVDCDGFVPFLNSEHDSHAWVTPGHALMMMHLHPGVRTTLAVEFDDDSWSSQQVRLAAMDAKAPASTLLRKALDKWGAIWRGKLDALSLDLSTKFADKSFTATQVSMAAAFKAQGFTVKFKPTPASKEAFAAVVNENVNLIRSIPEQYLKDVESQVWQSVMKGSDMAQLSRGIQEKYGVAYRRAALIARDQNNKAKAVIENTRRKELGIKAAIWQHSTAGKEPRPTHVAMDGKPYKLEKGMYDSAIGKHTWPGVEINCRCTSRAIIAGF